MKEIIPNLLNPTKAEVREAEDYLKRNGYDIPKLHEELDQLMEKEVEEYLNKRETKINKINYDILDATEFESIPDKVKGRITGMNTDHISEEGSSEKNNNSAYKLAAKNMDMSDLLTMNKVMNAIERVRNNSDNKRDEKK